METITVKNITAPKGNGPGWVNATDGRGFKCWRTSKHAGAALSDFQEGGTYQINTSSEEYQGKLQYMIIGSSPVTNGSAPAMEPVRYTENIKGAVVSNAPLQQVVQAASHAMALNGAAKDKEIWTMALMKSFIESGEIKLNPTQITHAWNMLLSLHDDLHHG